VREHALLVGQRSEHTISVELDDVLVHAFSQLCRQVQERCLSRRRVLRKAERVSTGVRCDRKGRAMIRHDAVSLKQSGKLYFCEA
jgi:hypothetical protein